MLTVDTPRQDRLMTLEAQIEQELEVISRTKLRLWTALAAIRDEDLWQITHASFKAYVKSRWGWEESNAHEVASAGQICGELMASGVPESQLSDSVAAYRPLKPLEPEQRREAWVEAVRDAAGDSPTTAEVRQAVERVTRRDNTLTPGSRALVTVGEHKGTEVRVERIESAAIAHSQIPGVGSYPFMVGELQVIEVAPVLSPPPRKPTLKEEFEGLKVLLRQCYEAAVGGCELAEDLVIAIERALG